MSIVEFVHRNECYEHLKDLVALMIKMKDDDYTRLQDKLIVDLSLTGITKTLGRGSSMKDSVKGTSRISKASITLLNSRKIMPLYCYQYYSLDDVKHLQETSRLHLEKFLI